MRKVQVLILSVLVVILGLAFLPPEVSFRYISMFTENMEDGDVVVSEAEREASKNSSENRIELLKNSLIITAKHPLLGVGPGNFPVAENDLAIASGERKGQWHVTHNMYTQISSEVGIPAAICYLSILAFSFRYLKQIQKLKHHPEKDDLALAGFWVRVALIGFSAGGFFLSVGYVDILPLLAGISAVLMKSAIAGQTPAPVAAPVRTAPRLTPQLAPAID